MSAPTLSPHIEAIYEVVPGTGMARVKPKYKAVVEFLSKQLDPHANDGARVQVAIQLGEMPAAERDNYADRFTACDLIMYLSQRNRDYNNISFTIGAGVSPAMVRARRQSILHHLKALDPVGPFAPNGPWDVCSHCGASTAIELPVDGGSAGGGDAGTAASFKLIVTCTGPRCFNIEVALQE